MELLSNTLWGNTLWGNTLAAWAAAIAIAALAHMGLRLVATVLVSRLAKLAKATATHWDDVVTDALGRTKSFVLLVMSVFLASLTLTLPARLESVLEHLVVIVLLAQVGIWFSAGISRWIALTREERAAEDAAAVMTMNVIGIAVRIVVWSMVLLLALNSRIRNFGRMFERRVVFEIGVTYQTPRESLRSIPGMVRRAVEEHDDKVRFDRSHFKE